MVCCSEISTVRPYHGSGRSHSQLFECLGMRLPLPVLGVVGGHWARLLVQCLHGRLKKNFGRLYRLLLSIIPYISGAGVNWMMYCYSLYAMQACTEMTQACATNNVTDMFPPTFYDPSAHCKETWGVSARPGWMNTLFWGKGIILCVKTCIIVHAKMASTDVQ